MSPILAEQIAAAVAGLDLGKPTAAKRGRTPRRPYVPIVDHGAYTKQIRGFAFATLEQAIDYARRAIAHRRVKLAERLAEPRHRLLREQFGLPREIA